MSKLGFVTYLLLCVFHLSSAATKKKSDTTLLARLCVADGKPAITTRRGHAALRKLLEVTSSRSLELKDSHQHRAACWIIFDDLKKPSPSSVSFLQRYALATFYYATMGDNKWDFNYFWLSKKDECSWYGVGCTRSWTGTKYVTALDLGFNNLTGLLPQEIALLTEMQDVDLHGNEVNGVLPIAMLTSWKKLKVLRLHMNGLFGHLPAEVGLLTSLRELHLFGNYFQGSIPTQLANLKNLERVDLYANNFSGSIPASLGNLHRLEEADFHDNDLRGRMPKAICESPPKVLVSDCLGRTPEVKCECCTICCQGLPDLKCVDVATGEVIKYQPPSAWAPNNKQQTPEKKKRII